MRDVLAARTREGELKRLTEFTAGVSPDIPWHVTVGSLEHTQCPDCHEVLIERCGYLIRSYNLTPAGACPSCGTRIPGRWSNVFTEQRTALPLRVSFLSGGQTA